MSRVKTFDSTGLATAGRIYAGDLNSIQDQYADLYNLAQALGIASVAIGESGLQLLRYGAGEARISGLLRTDGMVRALGGVYFGAFTTTQRDAIASGFRPFGLHVFNTTTGQVEWNSGSDATPVWVAMSPSGSQIPVGGTMEWPWAEANIPTNFLAPYGQAISRSTYAALNALASAAGYPHGAGNGTTTFNLPDYRGRVGIGKDDMGGSAANRITSGGSGINGGTLGAVGGVQTYSLVTGELPVHNHAITGAPSRTGSATLTGAPSISGSPAIGSLVVSGAPAVGSLALPNHVHSFSDPTIHFTTSGFNGVSTDPVVVSDQGSAGNLGVAASGSVGNPTSNPSISGSPAIGSLVVSGSPAIGSLAVSVGTLAVSDTIAITVGSLATSNAGSGTAHQNVQPGIVVNMIMRVL